MSRPRVLIDASNLVAGGGLQVGASVVDEIFKVRLDSSALLQWPWLADLRVEASAEVLANVTSREARAGTVVIPGRSRLRKLRRRPKEYDVAFAIFGPVYDAPRTRFQIMGFGDGTSLYPEMARAEKWRNRLFISFRSRISRRIFREVDRIVVEAAHIADDLNCKWNIPRDCIRVVPNVLNDVFYEPSLQTAAPDILGGTPTFAFPTRAYPHKNLAILGRAAHAYQHRYGEEVRFALTLTAEEWEMLPEWTRLHSFNVGPLKISQLPSFLGKCDATIFPSLLECFSVTPLEALAAGSPLLASDRKFVRSIVGESAEYFDPLSPESVASAMRRIVHRQDDARVIKGMHLTQGWPSAAARAESYLNLISEGLLEMERREARVARESPRRSAREV